MPQSIQGFAIPSPVAAAVMQLLDSRKVQNAYPYAIANSGTVTAVTTAGNLTLGTALNQTYSGGIWLFMPSTALAAPNNVAGWYFAVMSSTTVGSMYLDSTQTVIIAGSGAGYTGDTTERALPVTFTIPANTLGLNGGSVRVWANALTNNSAGAKTLKVKQAATALVTNSSTTSTGSTIAGEIMQQGNSAIIYMPLTTNAAATAGTPVVISTASDLPITMTLQLAVATDVVILQNFRLELFPF